MIHIVNTGGTFNKRYDPISGELIVPQDNRAVESILNVLNCEISCEGIIYKDSLQMEECDRKHLGQAIIRSDKEKIVIVHGTDTMDVSAAYLHGLNLDKVIVFTGAMVPFEVDPIEATSNLSMAIAVASMKEPGVYIVMQGMMGECDKVKKNRELGRFEYV